MLPAYIQSSDGLTNTRVHTPVHFCARTPANTHAHIPADVLAFKSKECIQDPLKALSAIWRTFEGPAAG